MHYIPYNSVSSLHKDKFGALCQGDELTLRVVLPRDICCSAVRLVYCRDGEEPGRIDFRWERMEGRSEEWWVCSWQPQKPALYWYFFEYDTPFGTGNITDSGAGLGDLSADGGKWQLTVYAKDFETPASFAGGVIYQIFPDRFNRAEEEMSGVPADRILRSDWGGCPEYRPDSNGKILNNDYFQGNLKGIEEKLDYLESLGVTCIYLNPIFEAHSNHRYDTADYTRIDPLLGTKEDFTSLCKKAEEKNIKIILDGVFNHTGSDSVYFNKYDRYPSPGAYNSKKSPYYHWYKFTQWPDKYDCWWNIDILPAVCEENEDFLRCITGEDGVLRSWLRAGASGWRLDVADELPDVFLDKVRETVKDENPEALILGEVWEDASNKISYSQRRRYLLGKQLDSVMNYPFADAIMYFLRTGIVNGFTEKITTILENYPPCVIKLLMNHIGTHDTTRAITALAGDSSEGRDRQWQSAHKLTKAQRETGVCLMKLASAIQFTLPGIPCIYYGDEAGLEGYADPFNRRCYPWGEEDDELLEWYRALGRIRRENPALTDGSFIPVSEAAGCVAYIRQSHNNSLMVIINRNPHDITYYLPAERYGSELILGGNGITYSDVDIPPLGAVILRK